MFELQRIRFVGWALTEGQYRPRAGKKKKTREAGLFFLVELQSIRFAGWALTEGQHRPKAGKKKKTREAGLFFLVPTSQVMLHPKWVKKPFPDPVRSSAHIV